MKKVIFLTVFSAFLFNSSLVGSVKSDDPVLLKINEREITISEFEYVYTKNNLNPQVMDPKSIDEYLDLFINFNLKVYEAMQLGLDTHTTFINELDGYRQQLAQPYLTDQDISNQLMEEAYERMQFDLRAAHILFKLDKHASPADTLVAWEKAMEVREKILAGESFGELAMEFSDDPSAKGMPATANRPAMRGNAGDLGYFSALDMVYPFENAAYSLDIEEVSMPVRSTFGYHILKLSDKLPAMGRARIAHIMVNVPAEADETQQEQAKAKILEIQQKLKEGESFESLAERFSDDKASGRKGGELPAFTSNRMVPEFIKAISTLNEQDTLSEPVRTQYGWHLIKFFERQLPTREEAMAEIKTKITRDTRASLSQQVVVDRLKKEYGFTENPSHLEPFFSGVDNTIFEGKWDNQELNSSADVLFSFAGKDYTASDFAEFLHMTQNMRTPEPVRSYVTTMYANFKQEMILEYEEENLPNKYPEFKKIMNEYHDGILLFELTDQKVWGKAMADTVGLKQFFADNISNYLWKDRYDAEIYVFSSESAAKAGRKLIKKSHKNDIPHSEIVESLNTGSQLTVSSDAGAFEIESKPILSQLTKKKGISKVLQDEASFVVVWVNEFLPAQPKKLNEIRGLVIADYQNFLEDKWIAELRAKYPYVVNREALNALNTNR
jgi:peptidyl-prolyl cis-trans isomerase SurA